MGLGAELTWPDRSIGLKASAQHDTLARTGTQNDLLWRAMVRWMDRVDPGFRDLGDGPDA